MATLCAKLRQREKNKYRKIVSVEDTFYSNKDVKISSSVPYAPGAVLEDGEWFKIQNFTMQNYSIDLIASDFSSGDFSSLSRDEFKNVDFVFIKIGDLVCFQNVSKAKLVSKKCVLCLGQAFTYQDDRKEIIINDVPDAIYDKAKDELYFRRLESITSIFKGIDQLYRAATEEETEQFLSSDFIHLKDGYSATDVKTPNRKKIALAQKTLSALDKDSKTHIFEYIGNYCPTLKSTESSFDVGSEDELKLLLYGIEQRFYTTIVGGEKRIANSVVPLVM